ncbi:MAG: hypothetical protein E6I03_13610 [Chloroflexi bacterium]|nr:MAG: hypothetical protein E6I03_13610 [Chloroflexota bacterium]
MAAAPCRNAAFRLIALPLFAAIVSGCWENDPPPQPPKPESNWTLDDARSFDQFPLYWLGANYEGMPLTLIRRRQATSYTPPPTGRGMATPDYVSYSYGELSLTGDPYSPSWMAPLEITIYPYCENSPEQLLSRLRNFEDDPNLDLHYEVTNIEIRGADGYIIQADGSKTISLWTGASAVFVNEWKSGVELEKAAQDLFPIAEDSGAELKPLPPPTSTEC